MTYLELYSVFVGQAMMKTDMSMNGFAKGIIFIIISNWEEI